MGESNDTEIYSESNVQALAQYLCLEQKRGTRIKIMVTGSGRSIMARKHMPRLLDPKELQNICSTVEGQLVSQAVVEGVHLEDATVKTWVELFPESGQVDCAKDYEPEYRTRFKKRKFKLQIGLESPTSRSYF